MITFQKLRWGYCFSYGDNNEIQLDQEAVTQIIGVNGNGKSSIPLIIEELIFNKNSKGIKKADIPNRYSNKGYWAKLDFSKDEDQYLIDLDRKTNIKVKFYKNCEDISSHTATNTFKSIEEVIGTDFKTFSQLVYQNTTNSLQFLTATDTNRKKFFIDLLNLEEYVRLFEVFKEAVKQHASVVAVLQGQITTVERWLAQNKLEDLDEKPILPVDDLDLVADERSYSDLSSKLASINKTNQAINRNSQYKDLLAQIDIGALNAIEAEPTISYDREQAELGGLTSDKTRRLSYIKKLESLRGNCPTCEQPIEDSFRHSLIEEEKRELGTIESKIQELNESIARIKKNNSEYAKKQAGIKEWQELFSAVDKTLPAEPINKNDLQAELSDLAIRISNAKQKMKQIQQANMEAAKHNSRVSVYVEQSERFSQELSEASAKLEIENKNLASLELLKKAFSTNGLIAYKIENLVKDLESLTNDYLAELSDGRFTINFGVVSDKLNVVITDNGNDIDILALSSGELARVNTATLLALRKLMSTISSSRINILFLDEVINVLDQEGRDRLVDVLLEEDLNTYIVSHGWEHPLLDKLHVLKEDNISRIEHD